MIKSDLFYVKNKVTYPPFKEGLYLEEYFLDKILKEKPEIKRKYIPAYWTNFQIENWFSSKKQEMQKELNNWVENNNNENGYFTVVQYDDACLLNLPNNTLVYGACSGDEPIPLIYQDIKNKLESCVKKNYNDKKIFCSFVGSITTNNILPNVRQEMVNYCKNKIKKTRKVIISNKYKLFLTNNWSDNVDKNKQDNFINNIIDSKFSFAPRGYGRSSFRFFEILKLGTIPIYLWNDINWLPFQDVIDYNKFCIVLNVKDLNSLDNILNEINEEKYNLMLEEYEKIKYYFSLEGMYEKIINDINK